jgi:FkbM family methyltransferase|tara:strand:+ start:1159 stop:1923 length:765 start_codon:yes stop_codon:yes gene_type:complete
MGILEKTIRGNWLIYYIIRTLYEFFFSNIFFEYECKVFKYLNRKNNLQVVDIGSSNKVFSRFIARYLNNSKFYCFEPLFFLHKQLKIKKNNNTSILIKKGCGEKSKKITIYTPYKKVVNFFLYFKSFSSIDKNFLIKNLFYYFKNINFEFKKTNIVIKKLDSFKIKPDIIKIDTENYELNVLLGSLKTIKKSRPIIMLENPSVKIHMILTKLNYEKYQFIRKYKKLIKVKNNNKHSYNYFYICKKKKINSLFKF